MIYYSQRTLKGRTEATLRIIIGDRPHLFNHFSLINRTVALVFVSLYLPMLAIIDEYQ